MLEIRSACSQNNEYGLATAKEEPDDATLFKSLSVLRRSSDLCYYIRALRPLDLLMPVILSHISHKGSPVP